jgi:hypothetical protein
MSFLTAVLEEVGSKAGERALGSLGVKFGGPVLTMGIFAIERLNAYGDDLNDEAVKTLADKSGCICWRTIPHTMQSGGGINKVVPYLTSHRQGIAVFYSNWWAYHPQDNLDVKTFACGNLALRFNRETGLVSQSGAGMHLEPCRICSQRGHR